MWGFSFLFFLKIILPSHLVSHTSSGATTTNH